MKQIMCVLILASLVLCDDGDDQTLNVSPIKKLFMGIGRIVSAPTTLAVNGYISFGEAIEDNHTERAREIYKNKNGYYPEEYNTQKSNKKH